MRNIAWKKSSTSRLGILLMIGILAGCAGSSETVPRATTVERPNILLIVADDLGYADVGAFGSEITTPTLDSLASAGRMLTRFKASPACSPTRAMLLSGTDNHLAGLGTMAGDQTLNQFEADGVTPKPGYEAYLNHRVVSVANLMKDAGYHTYMAGKWHLGSAPELTPDARGFEESFVLPAGGASHFADQRGMLWFSDPEVYIENGQAVTDLPDDFYSSEYYTDKTIEYIDKNISDDQPFFSYLAYTAPHWPLQVPDDWIDVYAGRYDAGYEVLRAERIASMKRMGLVPNDLVTPPLQSDVSAWENLTDKQKKVESRKMEIYAAMVENMDYHLGRLISHLKEIGEYDNTMIVFMSDNGAEAENAAEWMPSWGPPGVPEEWYLGFDHTYANMGRLNSYVAYGQGWAAASTGPNKTSKFYTMAGGISVPAIIKYPGDSAQGIVDKTFMSVMDLAPTFIDIAGIEHPATYDGREVFPMRGESILPYLKDTKDVVHDESYVMGWELYRNSAIRKGDWKLVSTEEPYGSDEWELYNMVADPHESNNLAAVETDKRDELITVWDEYAAEVGLIMAPEDSLTWLYESDLSWLDAYPEFPRAYVVHGVD
jgi:arylsulfatase A-like enzyme